MTFCSLPSVDSMSELIAQQRRYFPLKTLKFNTPFQLSVCVKRVPGGMEEMLHHSQAPLSNRD